MCDRHQAEITVMQFTGHSLPVHHFVTARWDFFTLSHIVSQAVFYITYRDIEQESKKNPCCRHALMMMNADDVIHSRIEVMFLINWPEVVTLALTLGLIEAARKRSLNYDN